MSPGPARGVTLLGVGGVAAVAGVVSYVHMYELALRAGEGWRAWLLPVSVDGLLVAASMVVYSRRQAGVRVGLLPVAGVVLGLGASLAANVAAASPGLLPRLVAGWSPVALGVAFELLVLVSRTGPLQPLSSLSPAPLQALSRDETDEVQAGGPALSSPSPVDPPVPPADSPEPGEAGEVAGGAGEVAGEAGELEARAAELIAAGHGRQRIATELDVSEWEARRLIDSSPSSRLSRLSRNGGPTP